MINVDISNLTPEQSKCILESYNFLKKIPTKTYTYSYEWRQAPQHVAKIIEYFRLSKLEISDFARRLGLEKATIYYFNEGMDHNGTQWNDLNYYINKLNEQKPNYSKLIAENGALKAKLGSLLVEKARNKITQQHLGSKNSNSKVQIPNTNTNNKKEVATDLQKSLSSQQVSATSNFINLELYIKNEIKLLQIAYPFRIPWMQKPYLVALICKDFFQSNLESINIFCKKYEISSHSFAYYLRGFKSGSKLTHAVDWPELVRELENLNISIELLRNKIANISVKSYTPCGDTPQKVQFEPPTRSNISNSFENFESLTHQDQEKIKNTMFELVEYTFDPQGNILAIIKI